MATIKKACKGALYPKSSSVSRKLKSGGGFPDLNKDGKITKKDVLIGRGVLPKTAKKGMKMKKAQDGTQEPKMMFGLGRTYNKKAIKKAVSEGNPNNPPLVKSFSFKQKSGDIKPRYTQSIDTTGYAGGKKEFPMVTKGANSTNSGVRTLAGRRDVESALKKPNVVTHPYKKGGSVKKSASKKMMMKSGGKMKAKKCAYGCK